MDSRPREVKVGPRGADTSSMRVAVYARRSKADERTGSALGSVAGQLERCRARAEQEGWHPVEFQDDGASAWKGSKPRPGYEQMLAAVERGEVSAILCDRDDRLFRSDTERLRFYDVLTKAGIRYVYSASGQDFDLGTADGRKAFRDKGSSAEYYSDLLSERVRETRGMMRDAGLWGGGWIPYGYRVVDGRLVVDPDRAEVIRQAASKLINGSSLTAVAAELGWTRKKLHRLFVSPHGNRTNLGILSDRDYSRVLEVLSSNRERQEPTKGSYLLTGLLICDCGGMFKGKSQGKGRPRAYACKDCGRNVKAEPLEIEVVTMASRARKISKGLQDAASPIVSEIDRLRSELADLGRKYGMGDPFAEGAAEGIRERIRTLEAELESEPAREADAAQFDALMGFKELLPHVGIGQDAKARGWLTALVERVQVEPIRITFREGVQEP